MGLLGAGEALAADPRLALDAHLLGSVDVSPDETVAPGMGLDGGGFGGSVAYRAAGPLYVQARVGFERLVTVGSRLDLTLGLRVFLVPPEDRRAALSIVAEGGLDLRLHQVTEKRARGLVLGAAAVDLRLAPELRLRAQAGWMSTLDAPGGVHGMLGIVWQPAVPKPEPEPPSAVWLSYPHCTWVSEEAWEARVRRLDEVVVEVAEAPVEAAPAPEVVAVGGLAVAVRPGDEVYLGDGRVFQADAQTGAVLLSSEVGLLSVRVVGGGREDGKEVAVTEQESAWVRFDLPDEPWVVLFDNDSAVLSAEAVAAVQEAASRSGGWGWRVEGSFSTDRSVERNFDLGRSRAEAVRDVLIAAGVPVDRVEVRVVDPDRSLPVVQQRRAVLVAVPPGEVP
jgi:flagellar motor protein MotB